MLRVSGPKTVRSKGHVARMRVVRHAYRILVGISQAKRPLWNRNVLRGHIPLKVGACLSASWPSGTVRPDHVIFTGSRWQTLWLQLKTRHSSLLPSTGQFIRCNISAIRRRMHYVNKLDSCSAGQRHPLLTRRGIIDFTCLPHLTLLSSIHSIVVPWYIPMFHKLSFCCFTD